MATDIDPANEAIAGSSKSATRRYFLSSREGTDPAVFDNYIKKIAHNYYERSPKFESSPWQSQSVNITPKQAEEAEKQPFMYFVILVEEPGEEPEMVSSEADGPVPKRNVSDCKPGFRS